MISVTVEKYVGSQWKLTPEPNTRHNIEMLDIALQTHQAFDVVVPHGECVVAYSEDSHSLTNKTIKRIKRAVKSAALGKKCSVTFDMGE